MNDRHEEHMSDLSFKLLNVKCKMHSFSWTKQWRNVHLKCAQTLKIEYVIFRLRRQTFQLVWPQSQCLKCLDRQASLPLSKGKK